MGLLDPSGSIRVGEGPLVIMRAVTVTVAAGQHAAYWACAEEIVALWDAHGIQRLGGPYRQQRASDDPDRAVWLTLHDEKSGIDEEFRTMYSEGRGKALIERRPPLVAETSVTYYDPYPFEPTEESRS